MVKNYLFILFLLMGLSSFAQDVEFGTQAGYTNIEIEATIEAEQVSDNASGFFVGLLADFKFSENWHLQPSVNYLNAEEADFLSIPVMVQYYVVDSGFYLQAGPQGTIILEDNPVTNTLGLDAAFGVGYHITENFFIDARYGIELTNRYSNESVDYGNEYGLGIESGINTLTVGVGYKF